MKTKLLFFVLLSALLLGLAACTTAAGPVATEAPAATLPPTAVVETTEPPSEPTSAPLESTEASAPVETAAPAEAGDVVLEVVSPTGSKSLTMADLQALPAAEGQAGFKSSTGKITPPLLFRGVAFETLADLVGGLDPSLGVNVVAEDGYAMTISYDQITKGDFVAYDPATGDEKRTKVPLQAIIAYEVDGQPLPKDSDGTLRMVIISSENNQVTDGHWAVKWVNKIELKPIGQEWTLKMEGAISDEVDRNTYQSCAAPGCHQATWTDDKAQKWVGVPLWMVVGRVDDQIKHDGPAFFSALAEAGYTIELIASDGYSITLDSVRVSRNNNIVLAYAVNDNPLPEKYFPLRLVGSDLEKNEQAGAITQINLKIDPAVAAKVTPLTGDEVVPTAVPATEAPVATEAAAPTEAPAATSADLLIAGAVEKELALSEADLRQLEVVKITAEHPKKGKEDYEGIRLSTLFDLAGLKAEAKTLLITAADGFTAELELAQVQTCSDCLLAFTNTAGKFKLVMPGMESNFWVKDVIKLELK